MALALPVVARVAGNGVAVVCVALSRVALAPPVMDWVALTWVALLACPAVVVKVTSPIPRVVLTRLAQVVMSMVFQISPMTRLVAGHTGAK